MCDNKEKVETINKSRYCVLWDEHSNSICRTMCSLMEHQSLVDVTISCNAYTVYVHKCMLAASSPYFREQLEQNPNTEQIIFNGLEHFVIKAIIEFIYCGQTIILDEHIQALVSAAGFFQIRGLKALLKPEKNYNSEHEIVIPAPIFLTKKPKVAGIVKGPNTEVQNPANYRVNNFDNSFMYRRVKRKYVRSEADKACAQEANASRLALEALQRDLENAGDPRFEIEESCVETTVESFIPSEGTDMQYLNQITTIPIQVVNYGDLNTAVIETRAALLDPNDPKLISLNKSCMQPENEVLGNRAIQLTPEQMTSDKIKQFLGNDVPSNVEIMFKTSEGNFVSITDEVLENITEGTLQYQVIDENGEAGEIRELQVHQKIQQSEPNYPINEFDASTLDVNPLQEEDLIPEQMVNPRSLQFDNLTNLTNNYTDETLLLNKNNDDEDIINLVREPEDQQAVSEVYKAYRRILEPHKYSPEHMKTVAETPVALCKETTIDVNGVQSLIMEKTKPETNECSDLERRSSDIDNGKKTLDVVMPMALQSPTVNPIAPPLFNMNDIQSTVDALEDDGLKEEIGCAEIFPEQNLGNLDGHFNPSELMGNDCFPSAQEAGHFMNLGNTCGVLDLTKHHVDPIDMSNPMEPCNIEEDGSGDCSSTLRKVRTKKKLTKSCDLLDMEKIDLLATVRKTRSGNREDTQLKGTDATEKVMTDSTKSEKGLRRITPNRRSKQNH